MEKHGVEKKLKGYLTEETVSLDQQDWWRKVIDYMKTLSPSGVELEIMNLVSFDFSADMQANSNYYVSANRRLLLFSVINIFLLLQLGQFLKALLECIKGRNEADFCQALLNCCLKVSSTIYHRV